MIAKRVFGVVKGHREHITDHTGRLYSDNEVADILNTIHEENEQLKHRLAISEKANFVTALEKENEQLKNRVDELEDDNMKYTLSTDKLDGYTKRFMPTKCINEFRDCKTNRYYWLDNEDNFTGALELLNLLDCENENLKAVLNDFINILNRLQSNPTDKQTVAVARDMLQNMGKELEE